MRTQVLFDDIDASVAATSAEVQIDQRAIIEFIAEKTGLDGDPQLTIEEAVTKGGCTPPPTDWFPIKNPCDSLTTISINESPFKVVITDWFSNWIRVQYIPNGVTAGTFKLTMAYKSFT